ncbi:MFS transporter [Aureobasidium pullulans EXF-150]|uniref:MFS transporter n=1 Tax=Aureobasidium pullulans EXF-150 TaxID=1043002 RepID=A0A074XLP5_AURPU|nr:MFS transporter [Aureobasidium pullulans EXF-150]KEQ82937.1 MFS transporter [Aureobasidium pullulans EXF-150]
MSLNLTKTRDDDEVGKTTTLGHLRLRHAETNEIILIPTPSNDPNDPLNWKKSFRVYLAILTCLAMFMCNFLAAGATVAIVQITIDFTGIPPTQPGFPAAIAKIAYFFTTTALLQGTGNLFWMPLILKYGRRPMYLISFVGYFATILWAGLTKSYASELAARVMMGFFAGSGECIAPLTISDLFFLHERGFYMSMYTAALSSGVSGGVIISGLITINLSWRYIYHVSAAIVGVLIILVFLTFPETAYNRNLESHTVGPVTNHRATAIPRKRSFVQNLAIFHGRFVDETFWKIFYRPVVLLCLPIVLWATLVMSVTIGFLVAISSNFASAFSTTYGFSSWQSGLCFISGLLFTLAGIFFGGTVSDYVADYFTKRNGGIREPEMRLPAMTIGLICSPLGLILYGVGIEQKLHWIVPTLGLGFLSIAIAQATNVSLVYVIDSYRPIAGETVVSQLAFKSCFGFLLSFYTNPWIDSSGYAKSFGAMAGISAAVLLGWIPFYIWGGRIRAATHKWKLLTKTIGWSEGREVGE